MNAIHSTSNSISIHTARICTSHSGDLAQCYTLLATCRLLATNTSIGVTRFDVSNINLKLRALMSQPTQIFFLCFSPKVDFHFQMSACNFNWAIFFEIRLIETFSFVRALSKVSSSFKSNINICVH